MIMRDEKLRLASFDCNWPHSGNLSGERMAKAGLYYHGPNDKVVCPFCKVCIEGWDTNDDPLAEHKGFETTVCPFLSRSAHSGNIPIREDQEVQMNTNNTKPGVHSADAYAPKPRLDANGLVIADPPINDIMCSETERMLSFTSWPNSNKKHPKELYEAGFYYSGFDDNVRCFSCGGFVQGWNANDDPWVEHAKIHSTCVFVREKKSDFFVDQFNREDPSIQELKTRLRDYARSRGFTDYEIDEVLGQHNERIFENGDKMRDEISNMKREDYDNVLQLADSG